MKMGNGSPNAGRCMTWTKTESAISCPERLDLRSYERQDIDKIPTVHMGSAVSYMEKQGIQTNITFMFCQKLKTC